MLSLTEKEEKTKPSQIYDESVTTQGKIQLMKVIEYAIPRRLCDQSNPGTFGRGPALPNWTVSKYGLSFGTHELVGVLTVDV